MRVIKRELRFKDYNNCLRASQISNIIHILGNKGNDTNCLKGAKKESLKSWKILNTQQRFKSKSHNVFTEEINKIALSLKDDKRIQSNNLTETYAYGTSKILCIGKNN